MERRSFLKAGAAGVVAGAVADVQADPAPPPDDPGKLKLRYAVNIDTHFAMHPVLDRLRLTAEAGFSAVEFNRLPNFQRAPDSAEPNYDAVALYGEALRIHKLSQGVWVTNPCAGDCDSSLVDPKKHAQFLERVRQTTKIAPLVGGTVSTVTSGIEIPGAARDAMTASVVEALKRAAEIVEKAGGPTLVLEPLNVLVDHPGVHVVSSDHAAEIVDAVGSRRVRILFDVYHQQISEGNLSGNIRKHYDRIGYFQFGDHPGRHEPFTGEIYYPNVFKLIHALGYQGMVGGEYSPAGGRGDEATLRSLDAVRRADRWT
jgi:hydroxypyruvate isomerase